MASNLGCVGLEVAGPQELGELLNSVVPLSDHIGTAEGVDVLRWEDPSGARLMLGIADGELLDLLPSFAATPSVRLESIEFVSDEVATAAVVDDDGEQLTSLAAEFEERRLVRQPPAVTSGIAGITALGVDIELFASAESFGASPASLLSPEDDASEPPPHYAERGWSWPPRVGAESFISYGVFATENPQAYARLAGRVLEAEVRTVSITQQRFVHALVRTAGFDVHVCFPAGANGAPSPGSIVHGTVFLVGTLARPDQPSAP